MNDPRDSLELRLKRLALRGPSPRLDHAAAELFAQPALRRPRSAIRAALAAALTAAACLAVIFFAPRQPQPTSPETPGAPLRIAQEWSAISPQEIVAGKDGTAMLRVERHVVRQIREIDDDRGVNIVWERPYAESLLVPLEYN